MNRVTRKPCVVEGCTRYKGPTKYCHMHYWRLHNRGSLGGANPENEQHGMKRNPSYEVWVGMHQRCNNPRRKAYKYYGGRGIRVCARWNKFTVFLEDMGSRPDGMSLDRIDLDGIYEPANCMWADSSGQAVNRRQHKNKTGYKGVFRNYNRWYAEVTWLGTTYRPPSMSTPEEAAWMYDQWALALHGEYARLNFDYEDCPV